MTTNPLADRLARVLIELGASGYTLASWAASCGPQRYRLVPAGRRFNAAGPGWNETTVRGADAAIALGRAFLLGLHEGRRPLAALRAIVEDDTLSPEAALAAIRAALATADEER